MFPRALKFCFLMFFLTVSVVMAQIKLEVIPLNNRQAQDLLPIIRPLLDLNETVSGMGYQLIVQASPRKLREIKSLLKTIDTQRINLRITVKQGTRSQLNKLELEIGAEIPIGKTGRVIINSGRDNSKGVVVVGEKGRGEIRGKLLQSKSSLKEMNTQIITTLEGNSATIYFTRRVPFKEITKFRTGKDVTQLESTQFKDVRTGFMVLPQIRGNQVVLEISPQQSRLINGEIDTFGLNTVFRGRIGEWIELGGLDQNRTEQGSGIANTFAQVEKRSVFIKIEKQ